MPDGVLPRPRRTAPELAADTADGAAAPARPAQPRPVERRHDAASPRSSWRGPLPRGRRARSRRRASTSSSARMDRPARSPDRPATRPGRRLAPTGSQFGVGRRSPSLVDEDNRSSRGPRDLRLPPGLPDDDAVAHPTPRDAGTDLADGDRRTMTPVRILTETVAVPREADLHGPGRPGPDRRAADAPGRCWSSSSSAGWWSSLVAFGFGAVYARRALVPIRESLANQRPPCAASASSRPTRATSCGRR